MCSPLLHIVIFESINNELLGTATNNNWKRPLRTRPSQWAMACNHRAPTMHSVTNGLNGTPLNASGKFEKKIIFKWKIHAENPTTKWIIKKWEEKKNGKKCTYIQYERHRSKMQMHAEQQQKKKLSSGESGKKAVEKNGKTSSVENHAE